MVWSVGVQYDAAMTGDTSSNLTVVGTTHWTTLCDGVRLESNTTNTALFNLSQSSPMLECVYPAIDGTLSAT